MTRVYFIHLAFLTGWVFMDWHNIVLKHILYCIELEYNLIKCVRVCNMVRPNTSEGLTLGWALPVGCWHDLADHVLVL